MWLIIASSMHCCFPNPQVRATKATRGSVVRSDAGRTAGKVLAKRLIFGSDVAELTPAHPNAGLLWRTAAPEAHTTPSIDRRDGGVQCVPRGSFSVSVNSSDVVASPFSDGRSRD